MDPSSKTILNYINRVFQCTTFNDKENMLNLMKKDLSNYEMFNNDLENIMYFYFSIYGKILKKNDKEYKILKSFTKELNKFPGNIINQ